MKKENPTKLLEALVKIPSLSGFEGKIAQYIKKQLLPYVSASKMKIDFQNNLVVTIKGKSKDVVMLDAHLDQIGFVVNNIDIDGYVSIEEIGGVDNDIVQARPVVIQTYKGKTINGVVDKKPIHYLEHGESTRANKHTDLEVNLDIGVRKSRNVNAHIRVGDPLMFKPEFGHLLEDYYYGYGFDDKIGCYMLMELIKHVSRKKNKPDNTLVFVFSAQEEIGKTKASVIARQFKPKVFIELDVTTATDVDAYEMFEREAGKCDLDKGIVIYRGVGIYPPLALALERTARQVKAKIQFQATAGQTGYTNGEIAYTKSAIIGIPLRNMHTPVEVLSMKDVNNGIKLLKNFLFSKRLNTIVRKDS